MKKLTNKQGFTLIEVVLVLAIGGLIFLLAFIAFQQVSANRRDTQRRADAGRIIAEIQNYAGDNNNAYPLASAALTTNACTDPAATTGTFQAFMWVYLCGKLATGFVSPQANYTTIASGATVPAKDQIMYTPNSNCKGGTTGNKVQVGLEKGVACRDDQ